ncbi:MAG: SRPBCC domain-containing protein [Vicinamibacterales bacterium]
MAIAHDSAPASVTIRRTIPARREAVFAAWTTPDTLKRWSAPGDRTNPVVEVDLRVGGRYRIDIAAPTGPAHRVVGEYVEVDAPRRLVYTWRWETNPAMGETLITVDFHERGAETEVVLVHSRMPSAEAARNHEAGWVGCFEKLERLLV